MLSSIAKKFFGSANERFISGLKNDVQAINNLESQLEKLSDSELKDRTEWLRNRFSDGETLDSLLIDAFATVREAAKRTLGQRHFDVQILGGITLHQGKISEMKTGEGKTLVATLAVYLNALSQKGVHVVTVNDYLAVRDSGWMGKIYDFLGLSVGCITNELNDEERREQYSRDVTYGTNNEFGFDYLRDNMKFSRDEMVQRQFNFAIIDEVDSILIDEARTPLIISGPTEDLGDLYQTVDKLLGHISESDYEKDEKARSASYTETGMEKVEEILRKANLLEEGSLYDVENISLVHHANQALRAHVLFEKDVDYIVKNNKVIIIDEFTGRMMEGRRYSEGLHQALEAKENVEIQNENQTLASITFQNYFRLYPKLAGMTGTAMTEAGEFYEIYGLEVIEIPTNVPCVRKDLDDEVYRTSDERYDAITQQIIDCHKRKQPVLVGTVSIEKSEHLSAILKLKKIPHNVLNARYHEQEANIIAQAGKPGSVTIATNMAGRGTDIQLGGNIEMLIEKGLDGKEDNALPKNNGLPISDKTMIERDTVINAGGLFVLGTERHESRRIDNQLRGRSGRQGDPGASKFYLSLDDDLMRIFGSERIDGMLTKLGLEEGEAIVHPWVNKALEKAQQKVEARNFEIRKNLLRFDDVMNDQRSVIFEQRKELMDKENVSEEVTGMRHHVIEDLVRSYIPEKAYPEQWNINNLCDDVLRIFGLDLPIKFWASEDGIADQEILERITHSADNLMDEKTKNVGSEMMQMVEKSILLQVLDQIWKEHLLTLDHLRHGIGLRAYGQKDPLNEYKREAFSLFDNMLNNLRERVTMMLAHVEFRSTSEMEEMLEYKRQEMHEAREEFSPKIDSAPNSNPDPSKETLTPIHSRQAAQTIDPNDPATWGKVPRNALCPCKSGKKYKHCHGKH